MEKFLYPSHPVRCTVTGPSDFGKSRFRTILNLTSINDFGNYKSTHHLYIKIYIKNESDVLVTSYK